MVRITLTLNEEEEEKLNRQLANLMLQKNIRFTATQYIKYMLMTIDEKS